MNYSPTFLTLMLMRSDVCRAALGDGVEVDIKDCDIITITVMMSHHHHMGHVGAGPGAPGSGLTGQFFCDLRLRHDMWPEGGAVSSTLVQQHFVLKHVTSPTLFQTQL